MIVRLIFSEEFLSLNRARVERGEYEFPRDCRACGEAGAVVGHGRRDRLCHGPGSDRIVVRRGKCRVCERTFTFLPSFAMPRSRYAVDAARETVMRFVSDPGARPMDAAPDFRDTGCVPDLKTLYNWLHTVADRLDGARFEFVFGGAPMRTLVIPRGARAPRRAGGSMRRLLERLLGALSALKEKFDAGARILFQGFLFHAGNFFQVLFPGHFAEAVV